MVSTATLANAADVSPDSYVVLGLATCYLRQEGEIAPITVAEPVPSAYLEALFKGVPTSYQSLHGITVGELLTGGPHLPAHMPTAQLCQDFEERIIAAARTYQARSSAMFLVPLGESHTELNYSAENKRILNAEHLVTTEDNVKQHAYTHEVL